VPEEIILSGCSTGLASDGAGEQWFGLLRGFAAAGASRMIASLWPVRDEDGERLMEAVYTHDDAGASSPGVGSTRTARLVAASRLMLKSGAHPAAAAAFAVVGGATAFHRRSSADPGFHRDGRSASFAD
jgi:CHAT domain-containing protein